jgi:hypothetical protein
MPPARRIDRVTFLGARDATTVTIPWDSRQALLERLDAAGGAEDVIAAIRAVGTSRPIEPTKPQKRLLLDVLEAMVSEVGAPWLPDGLFQLRNALIDERYYGALNGDA